MTPPVHLHDATIHQIADELDARYSAVSISLLLSEVGSPTEHLARGPRVTCLGLLEEAKRLMLEDSVKASEETRDA
jgi:hypothetical protein